MDATQDSTRSSSLISAPWRLSVLLGLVHGWVDLATVSTAFRATRAFDDSMLSPFAIIVGYDLLAFALQTPLGMLADRMRAPRGAAILGLGLALAGVLSIGHSAIATMLLAGVGNALFHLGAGAIVLSRAGGRSAPAGLFVAPGALGLAAGMAMGRTGMGSMWPIAIGLAVAIVVLLALGRRLAPEFARAARPLASPPEESVSVHAVLALLMVSVFVRSYVGFGGSYQCPKIELVKWGLPIAAMTGKAIGGFVADRFGWLRTSVGALLVAAPLIAFSRGAPAIVLPATLLFQTTMPVTLTAVYRLMPTRPATAFGLPCLALIAGALPTFFPWGKDLYGSITFLGLVLLSTAALYGALRSKACVESTPAAASATS